MSNIYPLENARAFYEGMRKEGEVNTKSIKIWERLPPWLTTSSMSLRILSMRRIIVKVIRPMKKRGRISFRI